MPQALSVLARSAVEAPEHPLTLASNPPCARAERRIGRIYSNGNEDLECHARA